VVETTLAKLEGAYALFSDLFHFVPDGPLRVTLFADKQGFDAHVTAVIRETRPDFVYIHYSDAAKSELVAFAMADERLFDASLLHQACIQFLKARIPNPPVWIYEGTAAYLERSTFSPDTGTFEFRPNTMWLEQLKARVAAGQALPVEELVLLDAEGARASLDSFYPQAWALVSLLLDSDDAWLNRVYWDSLTALDPALSTADNSRRVEERALRWYGGERLQTAYLEHVSSLKGYSELVAEGTDLYAQQQYDKAEEAFLRAMRLEPDSFVPYYYAGLIKYATADHSGAEVLLKTALDLGAEPAITKYALGVNAFAASSYEQSAAWLTEAKNANPTAYGEKVESLLARMSTLR
jgi:tetratricopeptide (TPR) repeat protein